MYIGDEFLALYHCIRSLAVQKPFPDAQDNLTLLFEKVKPDILQEAFLFYCYIAFDHLISIYSSSRSFGSYDLAEQVISFTFSFKRGPI